MKLLILTILILFLSSNHSYGQSQIPNGGFEEWDVTDTIPPINPAGPIGWTTSNFLMNAGANQTVFLTEDAVEGNFAARLVSDTSVISPPFGSGVLDTIAGFLALGVVNQINVGGVSYTERPDSISVWIKSIVMPNDTSSIMVTLTRFNNSTQNNDTIAIIRPIAITTTDSIYKKVTVPFLYQSNENPDLLLFRIGVGGRRGTIIQPGNELFIDDIQLIGLSTSTDPVLIKDHQVKVMPNPFTEQTILEFENLSNDIHNFNLVNNQGQIVRFIKDIKGTKLVLQRNNLPSGLYFFTFHKDKKVVYSGNLMIAKH